jgi:hypothetical protein
LHDFDSWQSQSQLAELFLWKCNATSKYNANTSDLSGKLIKTIAKSLFEKRLLSKG